jgi:predicted Zn finger-like uncharacterized protein
MLIVCPNCATPYGVEMASLRPASGWTRKLRCHRCRWVWQAQLSDTDKLLVAADAVPPVRRTLAAIAQAAADAARATLPRLRRATAVLADELEPGGPHAHPACGLACRAGRGEAVTPDDDPAEPAHLSEGCPGHWHCQAPVLVAIVAAILVLVTVLITILATIVVAVAAVTVTFAVPYSRTCAD